MFILEEFSHRNRMRCEHPQGFNHYLLDWTLSDWMTALMGELGEAANVVKKLNRCRDDIRGNAVSEEDLKKYLEQELADTFIYLDLTAQRAGINLAEAVKSAFNAKSDMLGCEIKIP